MTYFIFSVKCIVTLLMCTVFAIAQDNPAQNSQSTPPQILNFPSEFVADIKNFISQLEKKELEIKLAEEKLKSERNAQEAISRMLQILVLRSAIKLGINPENYEVQESAGSFVFVPKSPSTPSNSSKP